jgi:citrate lyase subunit beta / citryl-CoA lyase
VTDAEMLQLGAARSFLSVPGDRPERFDKAAAAGADIVIVDLEDAVAPSEKDNARRHISDWLGAGNKAMVRVNAADTQWHNDDLNLAAEFGVAIMVAKAENPDELARIAALGPGCTSLLSSSQPLASWQRQRSAPRPV